ncbi:MAG: hypothetical protein BGO68_03340 [Candidatus Amoebophilus sp. 36-38]|nr:MAG: hypothetical protein BGO68_03340 [Candidatus Amoebophilus sp. 36-38]
MGHAKIQRPRNIAFLATVIMTSLTFPTLLSCNSAKDVKSRPLLNKSKSAANLKVDPTSTNTTQPTDSATARRNWICASCGYANTRPYEVCTGCGLNKQDILNKDKVKKPKVDKAANTDDKSNAKPDASAQADKEVEACPVCFEEGILANDLSHECQQCKKLICDKCHKKMQKKDMNFCPLCRYEPNTESQPKPTHRRRSNSV